MSILESPQHSCRIILFLSCSSEIKVDNFFSLMHFSLPDSCPVYVLKTKIFVWHFFLQRNTSTGNFVTLVTRCVRLVWAQQRMIAHNAHQICCYKITNVSTLVIADIIRRLVFVLDVYIPVISVSREWTAQNVSKDFNCKAANVVPLVQTGNFFLLSVYYQYYHFFAFNRYYSDRGSCVKCYLSCDTCSGPRRDQCVKCPSGWLLANGECHPECPEGFFKTDFGCQKCHHYCKTCNGQYLLI